MCNTYGKNSTIWSRISLLLYYSCKNCKNEMVLKWLKYYNLGTYKLEILILNILILEYDEVRRNEIYSSTAVYSYIKTTKSQLNTKTIYI